MAAFVRSCGRVGDRAGLYSYSLMHANVLNNSWTARDAFMQFATRPTYSSPVDPPQRFLHVLRAGECRVPGADGMAGRARRGGAAMQRVGERADRHRQHGVESGVAGDVELGSARDD